MDPPHHIRKKKELFFSGMIVAPGNILKYLELRGPPTFEDWEAAMIVGKNAFLMAKIITPNTMDRYIRRVRRYARRYGPQCWALLYQAEIMMRT